MSRIGKKSIILSKNIDLHIKNHKIIVKGPKGQLSYTIPAVLNLTCSESNNNKIISITTTNNSKKSQQLHGLSRTLVSNMILGVEKEFTKSLEIQGVGYRSQMQGRKLVLSVGYSHPVIIDPPMNANIKVEKSGEIVVSSISKEEVGLVAAKIRAVRPPEPYKGKGIRYKGENIKKKVGKAGK